MNERGALDPLPLLQAPSVRSAAQREFLRLMHEDIGFTPGESHSSNDGTKIDAWRVPPSEPRPPERAPALAIVLRSLIEASLVRRKTTSAVCGMRSAR